MISIGDLPTINAALNAASTVLLTAGYLFIRRKRVRRHRACMVAAFVCSTAFLACYLTYHYHTGHHIFPGHGWVRLLYLSILATHTILAALVVPLVLVTLVRALKGRFDRHRRIARWALPIWLYVSVTGVVIYWMLYHLEWQTPTG